MTHYAHYDDKQFDEDREAVFAQLKEVGVERVVNISNGWDDMLRSLKLVEQYPFLYGTVGIHPCKVSDLNEERMSKLRELCHKEKIVAVGEIGLDYYWMSDPKEVQKEWFIVSSIWQKRRIFRWSFTAGTPPRTPLIS